MAETDVKHPDPLQRAMALHRAGNLVEAEQLYKAILNGQQDHPAALHMLGVLEFQRGRSANAIRLIDEALVIRPDYAQALIDRGSILCALDRQQEGLGCYDQALAIRPGHVDALCNRGYALQLLDRQEEALASYDQALAINPNAAEALNNRGNVLYALKRLPEALESYDRALAVKPDYAEALNNRGTVLNALEQRQRALESYDRALAVKPDYAEALNNRGNVLLALKRLPEALESCDRALALKRDYVDALFNRGNVLAELKRVEEAVASYDQVLALNPNYWNARNNRTNCRLLLGRFKEGWKDYEGRREIAGSKPNSEFVTWQGEDLSGRHLLVFAEQGLGDTIQFCRYLPLLVQRGCRVSFLTPARLVRLLQPSVRPVEIVSELKNIPGIEFQVRLMSLPYKFNTDLSSIPNKVPYLKAEPQLEARWRARIGSQRFNIGIAWQGNPDGDQDRNIPLEEFVPLTRIPGVRLICLQKLMSLPKGAGLDQLARLSQDGTIEILGNDFDNGPDAFIDTAAVMNGLDLIIASDTSIVHLAGALGRPAWVALKHVPEWRWLLDREDSPWYPTLRLFRQPQPGNWRPVFLNIERELRTLVCARL